MKRSKFDVTLTPSCWDSRNRPFALDVLEWDAAVRLVESTGYRPNTHAGLCRNTTRPFIAALKRVIQQERVPEEQRPVMSALLKFLEGPGLGGVTLSRGYKRWDRA